jgi:DNA gyrase/topoisomerase IV subunit B
VFHSFANLGRTRGGTHLQGLRDALDALRGSGEDRPRRRDLERGMVAAVAVVLADVRYGAPTKDLVLNEEVRVAVRAVGREVLAAWLASDPGRRARVAGRSGVA